MTASLLNQVAAQAFAVQCLNDQIVTACSNVSRGQKCTSRDAMLALDSRGTGGTIVAAHILSAVCWTEEQALGHGQADACIGAKDTFAEHFAAASCVRTLLGAGSTVLG